MTFSKLGTDIETNQPVYILQAARRKGLYIIGATGMGKTGLIENLILQDIEQGLGVGLLDPHGDLTNAILAKMTKRLDDVILLDINDYQYPFGLNLFTCSDPNDDGDVSRATNKVMHIFKKLWGKGGIVVEDAWGVTLEEILANATMTFLEYSQYEVFTMAEIPLLLEDAAFRNQLIQKLNNRHVKDYWVKKYNKLSDKDQLEERRSTLNRVRAFLTKAIVENIVGQTKTTIDFRHAMDERKIVLVKLDSRMEDVTSLIGSMIIAEILNAAYSRENLPVDKRKQFNLYADEFQRFATEDFATLLTEARKFGIATTIAHQARYQPGMTDGIRAVSLQAANFVMLRITSPDAQDLAGEFEKTPPPPTPEEKTRRAIQTPVLEPIQHMATRGIHPLEHTRTFIERYGKILVENARLEEELERDRRHEEARYEHDLIAGVRYIAPPMIEVTNHSRETLKALNSVFYQAMKAGKEGKNLDDIPISPRLVNNYILALRPDKRGFLDAWAAYSQYQSRLVNNYILALRPDKRGFLDAWAAYSQYQYSTGLQVVDWNERKLELQNRLASLPAHRQTEIVPLQHSYRTAKQQQEQFLRKLLPAEASGVREHCSIVKKGSAYYIARPDWSKRDGTLPRASYFLKIDYILLQGYYKNPYGFITASPVRFEQIDIREQEMRLNMSHLWKCIPYCSWDDVVSFYCKVFQQEGVWFQVEPSLRERHWWQRSRSRVRVQYSKYTPPYRSEKIEELEVWTLKPGIEKTWYTTAMFEAELAERLSTDWVGSNLEDFITSGQLKDEMRTHGHRVGTADYELKKVSNEVAYEVAQETQKLEHELHQLEQIETTKPEYDAFVAEFQEMVRKIMGELATPAGRVEEDSGIQEIVMGHGIQLSSAEMEARISTLLTNLPDYTARVKIRPNAPQNPGKKCVSCELLNNPRVLVCTQCGTKIIGANEYTITTIEPTKGLVKAAFDQRKAYIQSRNRDPKYGGYCRSKKDVNAEILQRQTSFSGGSAPAQPQQPTPQARHARQVPVQVSCPNCGKNNSPGANFCNQCGAKLK